VFQRFDAFGSIRSIASMRRDGTDRRRVLWTAQDDTLLDVSPDGQRVLWRGNGNSAKGPQRWGLYTSDLRGHHIHLVHRSPPYPSDGCWSPDGKSIVFSRQGPGGATWIIPAAGGHKRRLLDQPRAGLAWQPLPPETNR
jgi:Tol biopolymer transport system component